MLPTKGYFKDIECPYNERSCWRPYCHFRHKKKPTENVSEVSDTEKEETSSVPTYKPTPKSELAIIHNKSHIPISYVPDLVYRAEKRPRPSKYDKPTYCPTPLSILSSANKRLSCIESNEHIDTIKEIKQNRADAEYVPSSLASVQAANDIDFESLSNEFDLIDEIINSNDKPKTVENKNDAVKKSVAKSEKVHSSKKGTTDKSTTVVKHDSGKHDKKKEKETRVAAEKESKPESKHKKSDKRDKSKEKSKSSKSNKGEPESQNRHKTKDKKPGKEKPHSSKESHKSSSKDKPRKEDPKDQEHKKHSKDKTKDNSGRKRSHSPSRKTTDKKKDKIVKLDKRSKSVPKIKATKLDKTALDSDQESIDDKAELNNYSDLDVDFDNEEDTMMECFKIFNEYKPPQKKQDTHPLPVPQKDERPSNSTSDTISIRKRIAHNNPECVTTPSQSHPPSKPKSIPLPGQMLANRYKVALAAQAEREPELLFDEIKHTVQTTKRPVSLLEAAKARKLQKDLLKKASAKVAAPSANVIDGILKGGAGGLKPVKIAPVRNVSLITKAKERLSDMISKRITIAQTPRGARVAHIPDMSLSNIPDVLQADKSKLPVNVRTRFLTMIADECVKLYISRDEAYTRALNEEFSSYEKCKVLATYRNSAMLTVNRLRKEIQERTANGLGLIGEGEDSKKPTVDTKGRNFYDSVRKWLLTDEELDIHGYPRESDKHGRAVIKNIKTTVPMNLDENQKCCARCRKVYHVDDDGWPLFEEECLYHPMKKRTIRGDQMYLCCRSNDDSGCCTSDTHVSDGLGSAELDGFQTTIRPESENDPRNFAVYALDCEMCYTTKGIELTRVTIVDIDCKTIYESLVKPLNPIIDYNTRFSGITKEQMDKTSTSILQIQANILHLCNSNTILVGHSLESDLKALKIVHGSVIDTAVLFPHKMGLPHKRALRVLASEYLRKIIQNDVGGHDSAEDAITCMELLKWKLKEELKLHSSEHSRKKILG